MHSGETILAKRIATVLSTLSFEEALECTKIHSISGPLPARAALVTTRQFHPPHPSVSDADLPRRRFPHLPRSLLPLGVYPERDWGT